MAESIWVGAVAHKVKRNLPDVPRMTCNDAYLYVNDRTGFALSSHPQYCIKSRHRIVLLYIVVEEDEEAQIIYRSCIALVMSNGHWVELRGDTRQVVKIRSYVVM